MTLTKVASTEKMERKVVEAFQEAKKRRRMKEEFSHFCTETSFTALTRIYNASSIRRRIGWTVLLLGMLTWLTVQCYWLLDLYFQYPLEVKMDIEAAPEGLEFPSVTICNMNPIKSQYADRDPAFAPLRAFTERIQDDDALYDLYNQNWDRFHPPEDDGDYFSTLDFPFTNPDFFTGTTSASETMLSSPPEETTTTAAQESTSSPPTATTEPAGAPPAPPARRKRDLTHRTKNNPNNSINIKDPTTPTTNDDDDKKPVLYQVEEDSFVLAGDQIESWRILESEIFHEDRRSERHKRSITEDRMLVMMNSSFNKWDTLETEGLNISYYQTRGTEYKAAMAYATLTAKLSPDLVKQSGHSLQDLIINCRYNGWPCSPKNFTYFHSYKYGNCYTFNSHQMPKILKTKFAGPEYGLTLEMYIQQKEYVPALAAEAGVRVLIHPRGTAPFPEDNGISIPPAHSSSVSIRKIQINRLPSPHGTCDDTAIDQDVYAANLNTSYSKLSCLKSCYQAIVQKHCNCSMPMYYVEDGDNVCDMTDDEVDNCTSSLQETVPAEYDECDSRCPQPCFEVDYDMLVSSSAWPSDNYADYLQGKIQQTNYLLMGKKLEEEDFVKLNVYFKDLLFQKIDQQRGYESQNLISDIGGQLGLWLGLSAITIGELCGLILSLFRSLTSGGPKDDSSKTAVKPFPSPQDLDAKLEDIIHMTDGKKKAFQAPV